MAQREPCGLPQPRTGTDRGADPGPDSRVMWKITRVWAIILNMKNRIDPILVFALSLILYLATLPRSVLPGDSGELIAASRTLSIAHPPGYPVYLMLGKIFSSVFAWGSMAQRYNMLSAVLVSVTLALVYILLSGLRVRRPIAIAVPLAMGTLEAFWLQATTAEVYGLNGLFTALLLLVALRGRSFGQRSFLLIGIIGGLALSHHLSMIYPLVCALGVLTIGLGIRPAAKTLVLSAMLGLIGLSAWLYVPIRASLAPPLVWGRTDTLSGFLSHITAQGYRWRLREFAVAARSSDSIEFIGVIARQAGLPLAILALAGLVIGVWKKRIVLAFAALAAMFGIHYAMYSIPDIDSHIFPALIGVGILAGFGTERIARLASGLFARGGLLITVCAFLLIVPNLARIRPRADEYFAIDYAHAIQESARKACGDSCIVITGGHLSSFPLFYASLVEPGGLPVFDLTASDPSVLGGLQGTANIDAFIAEAEKKYGRSRLALLGPLPPRLLGAVPRICGMVYVLGEPPGECLSPLDFRLRGAGEDLREYSSRLLGGSYYLHIARWNAQAGDTAGVRTSVEKALDTASDDVATHTNAAKIYLDAGMGQAAYQVALSAVEVDPEFFEAHDLLANLLTAAGRTDEAIARYKLALKGNPAPGAVHVNLANAYSKKSDHARAQEHYRKAIELDPMLVNAHVGLGLSLEASGNYAEALAAFRTAVSIDPASGIAYHAHASLLLRQGDNAGAAGVIRQGLAARPDAAPLLSDMGLVFLRQDRPDSAIAYLERSLEADPSQLTARGNLAVALERSGLIERAMAEYRTYISLAPPGRLRDRAAGALRMLEEAD